MLGEVARSIGLTSDRFGFEPEITARAARAKLRIVEVGVSYNGRTYDEGKKIRASDGFAAIFHIIRYSYFSGRPFKDPKLDNEYFRELNPPKQLPKAKTRSIAISDNSEMNEQVEAA